MDLGGLLLYAVGTLPFIWGFCVYHDIPERWSPAYKQGLKDYPDSTKYDKYRKFASTDRCIKKYCSGWGTARINAEHLKTISDQDKAAQEFRSEFKGCK